MNKFNKKWAQVACWKLKKYSSKQSNGEVPYSSTESLITVMMSFLPQTPQLIQQLPRWHSGRESTCQCRRCRRCGFDPWVEKIPWSRKWQPTAASLPGKFHGQRSLADYSSWGHKESNMTKHTHNPNLNPSMLFLVEIDRLILKYKRIAKTTLIKRNKVGELILLDFKTSIKWKESGPCCKGMAINMEWVQK